ncbi:hypothetical protein E4U44_000357 [Claviceps purpurea]|nr:hypothetical protein E4U44_000357 [Claviceps purpurea]
MKDLLVGPDTIFLNLFRLDHTEFGVLLKWARDTGTQDDKNFTVWQKLMVFLHIIGHHVSYRNVSNRFRMSIATINRIFNEILVALAHNLYDEFVTQPGPEYVSEHVELDPHNSQFNGCIVQVPRIGHEKGVDTDYQAWELLRRCYRSDRDGRREVGGIREEIRRQSEGDSQQGYPLG